eukprot:4597932-Pyramimonas_sp.AAC.1
MPTGRSARPPGVWLWHPHGACAGGGGSPSARGPLGLPDDGLDVPRAAVRRQGRARRLPEARLGVHLMVSRAPPGLERAAAARLD